jgi:hypothetical protein
MSIGADDFLSSRVDVLKAKIIAYDEAALGIASGAIQSYELETGQTRQKVTKANIDVLEKAIASLENKLVTLEARLCGTGATHYVPSW